MVNHIDIAAADNTGLIGSLVGSITGGTVNNCYARSSSASSPKFYGENTNGTLTSCYLVGGSQTDVTYIYPKNVYDGDDTPNDLVELLAALNTSASGNYYTWLQSEDNAADDPSAYPYLTTPTSSSKRRR